MCELQGDAEFDREDGFEVESFAKASLVIPFDALGPSASAVDEVGSFSLSLGWVDIILGVDVLPPGPDGAAKVLARGAAGEAGFVPVSTKRSLTEFSNFSVRSSVASSHFLPSRSCSL
jgi:hypothetical protein